jgi:DNA helicase-2/ATP-dependent DNA helicase PcrA
MDYLTQLNKSQQLVVKTLDGPVLVLAGAGAGKTKTITHRMLHLIIERGISPHRILAVTFTNKAAREMRERTHELLCVHRPGATGTPLVATFHTLCVTILRTYADRLRLPRSFTIYDRTDSIRAVKEALRELGIDSKEFDPKTILGAISRHKGKGVTAARFAAHAQANYFLRTVSQVWERYDRIVRNDHALDFDDLLLETVELMATDEAARTEIAGRFAYVHVDEYQDTNTIQYGLMRMIAAPHRNICAVGDIDQNIYSWRGSSIDNIFEFERQYPEAVTILLEENYRSTKTILAVANDIIQKNLKRKEKVLFTNNKDGEKMGLFPAYDESDEGVFVAQRARQLIEGGTPASAIAVLYRANFQSRALEDAFIKAGVPYRVLGTRFFDRKEIKDALAYLRCALNPNSRVDISRAINEPARGIGKTTLLRVLEGKHAELAPSMQRKVADFYAILERIKTAIETLPASQALARCLEYSGLEAALARGTAEEKERLENLRELVSLAAIKYDPLGSVGMETLLSEAALASDQDELDSPAKNTDEVSLMTVHAAKGLEFPYVFITGLEEGLFPHERYDESADDEEERRLFYVALTRAKEKVFLTYATVRTIFGTRQVTVPSEFITDINDMYLVVEERAEQSGRVIYID